MDEEPFNPDYVEVDRVLEVSCCEDKDTGEVGTCPPCDPPPRPYRVSQRYGSVSGLRTSPHPRGSSALTAPPRLPACGVLPGEVVFPTLRGQHLGAEGRRGPEQDRGV